MGYLPIVSSKLSVTIYKIQSFVKSVRSVARNFFERRYKNLEKCWAP